MADLGGVVLRLWGTKKHGKGYKLHDGKWIGEVAWNPVDEENPDPYHVGEFLAASERVERQCPRLEIGKHYVVNAYDPENNEEIATCLVCAGDEEDAAGGEDNKDPFRDLSFKFQEAMMNRVLNEAAGTVDAITGSAASRGRRVGSVGGGGNSGDEGLIKLDDGSYVTKEWLMASLVQQRQSNRRMEEELGTLRDAFESDRDQPRRESDGGADGGGGPGWMKAIGSLGSFVQKWLESRANNAQGPPQLGGAGGISGIPMIDQLIGGVAPGFMKQATNQAVGGAGAFEQNNPFGGSLLANMDLSSPGSMGPAEAPMQQPPTVPFGGQLGGPMSPPMGGQPMGGQPMGGQPMGGQLMGGQPMGGQLMGGQPVGANPMMAPSPMMQPNMNSAPQDDDYEDYDDYYEEEEEDMGATPETKKLAELLLEQLMPLVIGPGNSYEKEEQAKALGARILLPLAEQSGISKTQLMVLKMDPDTFAECLIASLPAAIKPVIELKKSEVKPIVSVVEGIKLDS
jgi:hypothetical protein